MSEDGTQRTQLDSTESDVSVLRSTQQTAQAQLEPVLDPRDDPAVFFNLAICFADHANYLLEFGHDHQEASYSPEQAVLTLKKWYEWYELMTDHQERKMLEMMLHDQGKSDLVNAARVRLNYEDA